MNEKIEKVFALKLGGIGDVLAFVPTLRALDDNIPDADIYVMVSESRGGYEILNKCPYIKDCIEYNHESNLVQKIKMIYDLRNERFDLSVGSYPTGYKSSWFLRAINADHNVGFPVNGGEYLFDDYVVIDDIRKDHFTRLNLQILKQIGIDASNDKMEIWLTDSDDANVYQFLRDNNAFQCESLITIHPASGGPHAKLGDYRDWPIRKWVQLCERIDESLDVQLCGIGGPSDSHTIEHIKTASKASIINASGQTSITETASLLDKADLHIGVDSGPMHMAVAVDTPVIALFGPTDPRITGPDYRDDSNVVIKKEIGPNPCANHFGPQNITCNKPCCMAGIEVKEVYQHLESFKPIL